MPALESRNNICQAVSSCYHDNSGRGMIVDFLPVLGE